MKKIKTVLYYLLSVHLLALLFLSAGRVMLLLNYPAYLEGEAELDSKIASALLRGVWFDNVVASYISILPATILTIAGLSNNIGKKLFILSNSYYSIVYTLVFGISIANIPYFGYFFKPLNRSLLNWKEEKSTHLGMLFQESSYYIYFLIYILTIAMFVFLLFHLRKTLLSKPPVNLQMRDYPIYIPICLLLIGGCLLGARGRLGYNPIRTSQAYFCNNSFLNQLGINPAFYFVRDYMEMSSTNHSIEKIVSEANAIAYVKKTLHIKEGSNHGSPVSRIYHTTGLPKQQNVIMVLMESMSTDLLDVKVNDNPLTPYLNQLKKESYYFENIYSAGIHTNHGILASLYGIPSLLDRNMMKNVNIPRCDGLPNMLQKEGYKTMFFMSHEAQYDNINAFILENGIEEVYSEESYSKDKIVNNWGVADDYLFEYAIKQFNKKAKEAAPFFATILTISNHPPYVIPEQYKDISDDPQQQIVAFADDAIRGFMTEAAKQEWFANTFFIFVGDHGKMVHSPIYDMPLSYNHVPLIIYSPALGDSKEISNFGGQIDIFPTVMGLLNRSFTNNTLGVDLLKEKRPYMFFSSDDAMGCIDLDYFYTYNVKTDREGLYHYSINSTHNLLYEESAKADSMRTYAASMLQTSNYMFTHGKLGTPTSF